MRLPYVRRKRGKLFWEPTPAMRARGFLAKPLGPESPAAIAEAGRLYAAWLKALAEAPKVTDYPPGTFGAFWDRMKGSAEHPSAWWARKGQRTREDYERAWVHIDAWRPPAAEGGDPRPTLSRTTIGRISTELCEQFYGHLEQTVSPRERWRVIKSLKVLLGEVVVRLRLPYASPGARLTNPQPRGRTAIWLGAEVPRLVATAERLGYPGMAIAIRVGWDTLFSPVDVWSAQDGWRKRDSAGAYIERGRTKTAREAFGHLTAATEAAIAAYIEGLGFALKADAPFIRQRNGHAYRSKDTFGDDFRTIRNAAFPGDTRQFQDLRRSGNVEADAAGADKSAMAAILANSIDTNRFLDETYTPPTVAKAREVAAQRLLGRRRLAAEITRVTRSNSGA